MLGDPQYKEGNDRFKRVLLKPLPNKKCGKFCRFSLFDSVYNAFLEITLTVPLSR